MRVHEIFASIDGEVNKWGAGHPTVFIRFQGCNLRCTYCDTPKSLDILDEDIAVDMEIDEIVDKVISFGLNKVTITGGEPLYQKPPDELKSMYHAAVLELVDRLSDLGQLISVETNGTQPIPTYYTLLDNVGWVVDYKWEYNRQMIVNYQGLGPQDWIKFVVSAEHVIETFNKIKEMRKEGVSAQIAVSSTTNSHAWLAEMLIKEKMADVHLNVQLHKLIGVA
jgi:7-carboxy-7-deazaguanine synthase